MVNNALRLIRNSCLTALLSGPLLRRFWLWQRWAIKQAVRTFCRSVCQIGAWSRRGFTLGGRGKPHLMREPPQ